MGIYEKLSKVQKTLKAPKGQYNSFGKYKYRSCEDILEAVKPLLEENKLSMQISDELIQVGDRYYVKASATLLDLEDNSTMTNTAYAREDEEKKGMDGSQITGTASSYARKYALNGLFLIDDTKDADTDEYHKQTEKKVDKDQLEKIRKLIPEENIDAMLKYYKIEKIEDMNYEDAKALIERKENANGKNS